jgi:two-component system sensor histidine kinase BarA
LLAQALQRDENTGLLYTDKGWLLNASAPVVNPVGVIGAISVGRVMDDELLAVINMGRASPILHLHGPDGAVLATSIEYSDHRQELVDFEMWRRALAGEMGRALEIEEEALDRVIYAPLNVNGAIAAVYSIEISTAEIRTLQRQLIVQTLLLLLGIGLGVAFLIYILMRQFITTPLVALGEATRKIGAGDLDAPLPPISSNEIGHLTSSFGAMVNQLRRSFETLENRVAERTTELTKSNNQLQREIEERGKVEVELIVARDKALKASRLKTELLAKVSHELRTPLGAILGYAELLHEGMYGSLTSKQETPTQKIINSAYYLSGMVNDLLDQAQLEAGKLKLNPGAFAPVEIVTDALSKMDVLAQSKGLTLASELAPNLPATLSSDATRLQQILVNLTSNAIKFTTTGSVKVQVYCPDADHWAMRVSDTGPGIPPEAHKLIFEPFGQVDGSMTRKHSGTGLGLSIVQHLVNLMGGQITLDSEVGRGSIFTVTLPLIPVQEKTP